MSWKKALDDMRKREATIPPGCSSLSQIAADMGVTDETASKVIARLVKEGRAERVPGKSLTVSGNLVACNYYRLIGKKS
jgi:DNA-binding MarR family transcriptional regulator